MQDDEPDVGATVSPVPDRPHVGSLEAQSLAFVHHPPHRAMTPLRLHDQAVHLVLQTVTAALEADSQYRYPTGTDTLGDLLEHQASDGDSEMFDAPQPENGIETRCDR